MVFTLTRQTKKAKSKAPPSKTEGWAPEKFILGASVRATRPRHACISFVNPTASWTRIGPSDRRSAATSPKRSAPRTYEDARGFTRPRLTMRLVAAAVAATFAAWSASGGKPRSAPAAALRKTAGHDGGLHDGLKTLGVHTWPSPFLICGWTSGVLLLPLVTDHCP